MFSKKLSSVLFLLISLSLFSQENKSTVLSNYLKIKVTHVPSIAQQIRDNTFIPVEQGELKRKEHIKRRFSNNVIPGKGLPKGNDPLLENQKNVFKTKGKAPSIVFDAATITTYTTSDPTGAIGPNHYLGGWNASFRIFDKSGNPLIPEASLATIFSGNNCGDPIMLYDAGADRYIITEFFGWNFTPPHPSQPWGFDVAVSQGSDPVTSGWNVYHFVTAQFPDYPKFSVWSDGYYITANEGVTNKVYVLERSKMLNGQTAQIIDLSLGTFGTTNGGFFSPQIFNVGDSNFPSTGNATVVYLQDDAWSGVSTDHLKLWTINVDWNNIVNSTISTPIQLNTSAFNSVFDGGSSIANLQQPASPDINALQATIMNQAQFRKFSDHNSAVFNFVVDTDGSSNELAGIRWYELRQSADGQPWSIYQEGTYISPTGNHAFNASMAIDEEGNIGMGYTTVSSSSNIAIKYTGRYASDPSGTMSVTEQAIAQSSATDPYSDYSDYSHLTVDPSDNKTFWFISEYYNTQRKAVVGVFDLANTHHNDVGVVQINTPIDGILGSETVAISLKNFGHNAQTNIPVAYQVDGGIIVSEIANYTLPSGATGVYFFSTPTNMFIPGTYSLKCMTQLAGDEDTTNDALTKDIHCLYPDDVGVISIDAPVSGNTLCMENITVTVKNFGANVQSGFQIEYILDGIPYNEIFPLTLNSGQSLSYTFSALGDFCAFGDHNLSAHTILPPDGDPTNDFTDVTITNIPCSSNTDTNAIVIGPNIGTVSSFISIPFSEVITDVDVKINLYHSRDEDLDIYLVSPTGTQVELTTDNGGLGHDYFDTYFDDEATSPITGGTAPFTNTYKPEGNLSDFDGFNSIGLWTLNITDDTNNGHGGTLIDWELDICFDPSIGIYENAVISDNLTIASLDDNQYLITLIADELTEPLLISIFDINGQILAENWVFKEEDKYIYNLDMSYVNSGVYLIKINNMVKRILVK